jgi:antitoxin (DNA-binding transcriptional repressor) of toxin-antitoxin stability system
VSVTDRIALGEARIVTMRELSQRTAQVMAEINESGKPALVTRHGRFQAIIWPVAKERIESFVLSHLVEFLQQEDFDAQNTEVDGLSTEEAASELGLPPPEQPQR